MYNGLENQFCWTSGGQDNCKLKLATEIDNWHKIKISYSKLI